jgi:multidrug resistance efflux pump
MFRQFHDRLENKSLFYAWTGSVAAIALATSYSFLQVQASFLGIAESREAQVSFEMPVRIRRILVVPGQRVERGTPLLELDQAELALKVSNAEYSLAKLRAQLEMSEEITRDMRDLPRLQQAAGRAPNPAQLEAERLQAELSALKTQQSELQAYASEPGTIAAVNFRAGEKVPPYAPVITLSASSATQVHAFIEEQAVALAAVDQEVTVTSITDPTKTVQGAVQTLGARIVEFPDRLAIVPGYRVFGREVLVTIPGSNPFLVGEKVKVTMNGQAARFDGDFFLNALAGGPGKPAQKPADTSLDR